MIYFLFPLISIHFFLVCVLFVLLFIASLFIINLVQHLWKSYHVPHSLVGPGCAKNKTQTFLLLFCPLLKSESSKNNSRYPFIHPPIYLGILHIISQTGGRPPSEHFHRGQVYYFTKQPVPELDSFHCEKVFPYVLKIYLSINLTH